MVRGENVIVKLKTALLSNRRYTLKTDAHKKNLIKRIENNFIHY